MTESGTTVSLSELTTLVGTFSSDPSMEFRISIAPEMPARKTQTLIYVSNMLFPLIYFLVQIVGGILIGYLLNSPDLHPVSTSRKELFGLHDTVTGRGPN
jgi:hypothetical protein